MRRGAWQRRFNRNAATSVELEELGELVLGLGCGGKTEAGGRGTLRAQVGVSGNELEQIKSDVFRATRCGVRIAGFHMSLSEHVARGDGIGLLEMVATLGGMRAARKGNVEGIGKFVIEKSREILAAEEKKMNKAELQRILGYVNIGLAIAHDSGVSVGHFGCGDFIELAQTVNAMLLHSITPGVAMAGTADVAATDAPSGGASPV